MDPISREIVRLFHPRRDAWKDHFESVAAIIVGKTTVGDATIRLLQMNTEDRVEMRAELQADGE